MTEKQAAEHVIGALATRVNAFYAIGGALHGGPIDFVLDTARLDGSSYVLEHRFEDPAELLDCLKDPGITSGPWGPPRRFGDRCDLDDDLDVFIDSPRRFNLTEITECGEEDGNVCCMVAPRERPPACLMFDEICLTRVGASGWRVSKLRAHGLW